MKRDLMRDEIGTEPSAWYGEPSRIIWGYFLDDDKNWKLKSNTYGGVRERESVVEVFNSAKHGIALGYDADIDMFSDKELIAFAIEHCEHIDCTGRYPIIRINNR